MTNTGSTMVSKRGGQLEPFDAGKLRRCLATAMRACQRDERFADALAHAVQLHLRDWPESQPPTTDYIFRCLRTALTETGMVQVAQFLLHQRRRRAAQRSGVSVWQMHNGQETLSPWRKARIAEMLERRYELGHSVARILAGEIERRVLALGYSTVSAGLIAELIRNELMAWGLLESAAARLPAG